MNGPRTSFDTRSDADLIRAAGREPAAFELLFGRHAATMRAWFFAQTGDVGVANDLLAETFARAWRGRRRFRGGQDGSGGAWLYGIGRHLVMHHHRRGRVEVTARRRIGLETATCHEDHSADIVERLDASALSPAIAAAFDQLSSDQRRAIGLRVIDDLSYREVADSLGCTTQTARARVSRGLRMLRSTMKEAES